MPTRRPSSHSHSHSHYVPFDLQRPRTPKRHVGVELECLVPDQPERWEPGGEAFQHHFGLEPGERGPQAIVNPEAERQVILEIRSVWIELPRVGESALVVIRRA